MIHKLILFSNITIVYIIFCICAILLVFFLDPTLMNKDFYRFGPGDNMIVLGIRIQNNMMYFGLIIFSMINTIFREIHQDMTNSWLINYIQNPFIRKDPKDYSQTMFINLIFTLYVWFDWFVSINMITTQIDLLLVQIVPSVLISILSTKIYFKIS